MGLSLSLLSSAWEQIGKRQFFGLAFGIILTSQRPQMTLRADSFKNTDSDTSTKSDVSSNLKRRNSITLTGSKPLKLMLETSLSFKNLVQDIRRSESNIQTEKDGGLSPKTIPPISHPEQAILFSPRPVSELNSESNIQTEKDGGLSPKTIPPISHPEQAILFSPRPVSELDAAAVKLQKVYKSYRTRRNLADCAVVVEELWWKALDFAALKRSSVSFFDVEKPETAVSRWARARTRAAKVGKGLSKNEKAQKLALQHWLEAIDPRHRYGHNLHLYYDIWFESESSQPFFYWLDIGDGKEVNLEKCPRSNLHRQCIKYLGPKEREAYEVIVENGKLVYRQSGEFVETVEGSKWIFVLSTSRNLYVGQKKKGSFQHSSFLAGGATTAAGRLVAHGGILEAVWPYSGHYHPTEENFMEFISFLQEHHVDLTNVKRCSIDDDCFSFKIPNVEPEPTQPKMSDAKSTPSEVTITYNAVGPTKDRAVISDNQNDDTDNANGEAPMFNFAKRLSCKWSTGAGPRIGCVRDYPADLQFRALEQVNLSPRVAAGGFGIYGPIPSPRPSPTVRLSPRISHMGLPSPRTPIAAAN